MPSKQRSSRDRPPFLPLVRVGLVLAAFSLGAVGCGADDDPDTGDATTEAAAPDLTALPLGDDKFSGAPKRGFLYLCSEPVDAGVGPTTNGPWIDQQAGTWNADEKIVVPGQVDWPSQFELGEGGEVRGVSGNDLPDHPTGEFPVPTNSEAYNYDPNPNEISEQEIALDLPINPTEAAEPSCMGGESGVLLTGAALFNGFDANGNDAVAHEVQDRCQGHPQISGVYHYHSQSECVDDNEPGQGHSPLIGYALDGFGIYGHHGEDGEVLANKDLDECHGHRHEIDWDGETIELYHYHATYEYPYTASCFRGEPAQQQVIPGEMPAGGGGADPEDAQAPPGGGPPPQ